MLSWWKKYLSSAHLWEVGPSEVQPRIPFWELSIWNFQINEQSLLFLEHNQRKGSGSDLCIVFSKWIMKYWVGAGIRTRISSLAVLPYQFKVLPPKAWSRCLRNSKKKANLCDMLENFLVNSPRLHFQLQKFLKWMQLPSASQPSVGFSFKILSSILSKCFALTATYSRVSEVYHLLQDKLTF